MAIVIFDEVEVLDVAGPFEVFAIAAEQHGGRYFDVALVGAEDRVFTAVNGFRLMPNRSFEDCAPPEILVVPGGCGSKRAMHDAALTRWIERASASAEIIMSICSGARILARLGLLDGLDVTTHRLVASHVAELAPTARIRQDRRFVDTGRIVTTGGISAGIDGALHLVARLCGREVALRTALYMEYSPGAGPIDSGPSESSRDG